MGSVMNHPVRREHAKSKTGPTQPPSNSWRRRLPLLVAALVAGGATWAIFEFVVWSPLPTALVGKWVIEGGKQDGADFDFYANGTMRGRVNVQGFERPLEARVWVRDGVLYSTTQHPLTGKDETRAQKILNLTSTDLVLEDEQGKILRLSRAE
jgi:hypothetical protein